MMGQYRCLGLEQNRLSGVKPRCTWRILTCKTHGFPVITLGKTAASVELSACLVLLIYLWLSVLHIVLPAVRPKLATKQLLSHYSQQTTTQTLQWEGMQSAKLDSKGHGLVTLPAIHQGFAGSND